MSSFRVIAGERLNILSRVAAANITVSSEDALYPKAGLYDGLPVPWKASAIAADRLVSVDLNMNAYHALESWTGAVPAGWTKTVTGTGTAVETTTAGERRSGSAAKIGGGASGTGKLSIDIVVRAGEYLELRGWMRGDATVAALARVYNPATGHYLQTDGTWLTAAADIASEIPATYAEKSKQFRVETYSVIRQHLTTVRLELVVTGNGFGYFDDWYLYPGVDFCGIFGHNLDPVITPEFRGSTDNFSGSDVLLATLTMARPSFYGMLVARAYYRYVRFKMVGTNYSGANSIGELVIDQTTTMSRGARHPGVHAWDIKYEDPQIRNSTRSGQVWAYEEVDQVPRLLRLPFFNVTAEESDEYRQEILERSRFGLHNIVVIPADDEATVILGRLDPSWDVQRVFLDPPRHTHDIYVRENPVAIATS